MTESGERVARLLHPLVFYLHNADRLADLPTTAAASAPNGGA